MFSPKTRQELKAAVDECLQLSTGCSIGPHGPIGTWDVSEVTDMRFLFGYTNFNGDISNWDVSKVTDMSKMFAQTPFNGDISNWDVSQVTTMVQMFYKASFKRTLCGAAWINSKADKYQMFFLSHGSISDSPCTTTTTTTTGTNVDSVLPVC